jgi:ethanolaminephosphotransferase
VAETGFQPQSESSLEQAIIGRICQPILDRVPRSIHPNTLSLVTHLAAWLTAASAYVSAQLAGLNRALALAGAGAGTFCVMVGDCLDGMQARRTNRCSKLGEMLDHWLDAMGVPLVTLGLVSALQLDPWLAAAVHITNTMIYNGQLVLFHHSGKFVHPGTTGVDAQLGVSLGYLAAGALFYFVDRQTRWVDLFIMLMGILAIGVQLRLNLFYYVRLRGLIAHHLLFVLLCGGVAALYLVGAMERPAFLLAIVFLSFRITGGYVQATIVGRRFSGFDSIAALGILALGATHYLLAPIELELAGIGIQIQPLLPYCLCAYLVGRNLVEFALEFHAFRPAPAKQA